MNPYVTIKHFIDYVKIVFPDVQVSIHPDRCSHIYAYNDEEVEIPDENVLRAVDGGWAESCDAKLPVKTLDLLEWQIQSFCDVPALGSPADLAKKAISC